MHENYELLSLNEYAAMLKQSRSNMYELMDRGEVPNMFKIGGRNFISKSRVLDWLREQEAQAA